MNCDAVKEGETILRVQEKTSEGFIACLYDSPERSWLSRLPFIGGLLGYEQFGWIKPKNPELFEQECFGKFGTKFKLIVKLEVIEEEDVK